MTKEDATAERIIRRYMLALRDPMSLLDTDEIAGLEKRLDGLTDPIDRVMVRQRILEESTPDFGTAEADFVSVAARWAADQDISVEAFIAEAVPRATLKKAGFAINKGNAKQRSSTTRLKPKRARVGRDEIRQRVPSSAFTVSALVDLTGGSPATVRDVVVDLVDRGELVAQGPASDHRGPGRAPMVYKRTG